jgi:N-acetylmuramoyl-L-alanine amidase
MVKINLDIENSSEVSSSTVDKEDSHWSAEYYLKQREIVLKERELRLKIAEFSHKKRQDNKSSTWHISPLSTTVIAGALTIITTVISGHLGRINENDKALKEIELKNRENQFQIVLKATEDRTPEEAAKNLEFFVDIGYLPDPDGLIKKKAKNKEVPTITSSMENKNPLLERVEKVKNSPVLEPSASNKYTIAEHILLLNEKPVPAIPSPNISDSGLNDPKLVVFHSCFCNSLDGIGRIMTGSDIKASAHLAIDRDGKVIQLVPFDFRAWHAGNSHWRNLNNINNYSIGIELVNQGVLTKTEKGWTTYSGQVVPESEVFTIQNDETYKNKGWHKFSEKQIEAATKITEALILAYPNIQDIVGHGDISERKKDEPGPGFPISTMRNNINVLLSKVGNNQLPRN